MSVAGELMDALIAARTDQLYKEQQQRLYERTDRLFVYLMLGQWGFAVLVALVVSPYAWAGKTQTVNAHVFAAVVLGGLITGFTVILAMRQPGAPITRQVIAVAQMLWSALLIHLTGGRIETHFHVFGSLAFLSIYRDWRVLIPATIVVATDHLVRQMLWPESVFGIVNPESWRFLEHAFWVVFEDAVLFVSCLHGTQEMHALALKHAQLEATSTSEREKSVELDRVLSDLRVYQDQLV